MTKTALITGILGQDGSYLAELLLEKGYEVYGLIPQRNYWSYDNVKNIKNQIKFIIGDMCDKHSLDIAIFQSQPDEIYNLASQSFVHSSWEQPEYVTNVNALGCLRLLELVKGTRTKLYQASTSEMFGNNLDPYLDESTPLCPVSPYGISKTYAHNMVKCFRESYGTFCCSGILFNHESPRRGNHFVTQKVVKAAVAIGDGKKKDKLQLGNLTPKRDFGHAKDYVKAMWLMLQQEKPKDYVIATGKNVTIEQVVDFCFRKCGLLWQDYVTQDPSLMRPNELYTLCGNAELAKKELGWKQNYDWVDTLLDMIRHAM